jgi:hypothetical protein
MASQTLVMDIETGGLLGAPNEIAVQVWTELTPEFDLRWTDVGLHDAADGAVSDYERVRRFKHLGGAIAWARRQIFHGRVFGSSIEMTVVRRRRVKGELIETEDQTIDITLAGFCAWTRNSYAATWQLERPTRKCRITEH